MLAGIFGSIVSSFFGQGLGQITSTITRLEEIKATSANNAEKLEAEQEIEALKAKRDIIIAENGAGGIRAWIRPLMALPVVIYLWKVIVWDKVVCSFGNVGGCSTDALGDWLNGIFMLIIGAYFVDRTVKAWRRMG